jgi:hypothetical protein
VLGHRHPAVVAKHMGAGGPYHWPWSVAAGVISASSEQYDRLQTLSLLFVGPAVNRPFGCRDAWTLLHSGLPDPL